MHARLESLARAVTWLNNRTTPSAMQRLNRHLVLHRPVLWRSRLIWVAWWSVLLSLVFGAIGYWIARSPGSVWATQDLTWVLRFVQYATVVLTITEHSSWTSLVTWTASYVLVRAYKTRFQAFLLEAVACFLAILLAVVASDEKIGVVWFLLMFSVLGALFWLTERSNRSAAQSRRRAWQGALCLLMFPALIWSIVRAVVRVGKNLTGSETLLLRYAFDFIMATLVVGALYLLALWPFVRALALAERAPKSD